MCLSRREGQEDDKHSEWLPQLSAVPPEAPLFPPNDTKTFAGCHAG